MSAVAIIPARGGSKRLPRKNIAPLLGRPLIAWTIDAALSSHFLGPGSVYVSTDDSEIAKAARDAGAMVVERPADLAGDQVWTEPVIRHAVETIENSGRDVKIIAWMNACVPEITGSDIDNAFQLLLNEGLREVVAVDQEGRSNSAVRILLRETLFQNRLSVKFAVMQMDYLDIHTDTELKEVETRLQRRLRDRGGV